MQAKDLMSDDVLTVREDDPVEDVAHALVSRRLHGAPVVNDQGRLVGIVSQQDVFFGRMTRDPDDAPEPPLEPGQPLTVKRVMTAPPVFAREEDDLRDVCRLMAGLRIHRLPVVRNSRVVGILSSLDVCAAVGKGRSFD
jgi:CBS domain-containing protein